MILKGWETEGGNSRTFDDFSWRGGALFGDIHLFGSALAVVGSRVVYEAPTLDWRGRGGRQKTPVVLQVVDWCRLALSR